MISRMYGTTGKWTDFISSIIALNIKSCAVFILVIDIKRTAVNEQSLNLLK